MVHCGVDATARYVAVAAATMAMGLAACGGDSGTPGSEPVADGAGEPTTETCSAMPPDCADYPGPASVVLGHGTAFFGYAPLQDGRQLAVSLGPQGLFMFQLAVLGEGMHPGRSGRVGCPEEDPIISTSISYQDALVGGAVPTAFGLTQLPNGDEKAGIFTPFNTDESILISHFVGETVTLAASITDVCGNSASDSLDVVVMRNE